MSRELWLLRHGKAERYDGMEDFDRALKKRGRRDAKRIGEWLGDNKLMPDLVISSPAIRAVTTAKIVCDVLDIDLQDIKIEKKLYDEGLHRVLSVLTDVNPAYETVLLVGHNPELEELLAFLVDKTDLPATHKLLPTASLARLTLAEGWSAIAKGCGALHSITYPQLQVVETKPEIN